MKLTGKASLQSTFSGWYPPDDNLKPTTNRRTRATRCRPAVGRRSRKPQTPLLRWGMEENGGGVEEELEDEEVGDRRRQRKGASTVSARKLAAGLWRLQSPETVTPGDGERRRDQLGIKACDDFIDAPLLHFEDKIHGSNAADPLPSPTSVSGTKNGLLHKACLLLRAA